MGFDVLAPAGCGAAPLAPPQSGGFGHGVAVEGDGVPNSLIPDPIAFSVLLIRVALHTWRRRCYAVVGPARRFSVRAARSQYSPR